jgi:hypothetical protein
VQFPSVLQIDDINHDLEFITIYTLFDITYTGVLRSYDSLKPVFVDNAGQKVSDRSQWGRSRNQQRNWETLVQLISLRAQPVLLESPRIIPSADLPSLGLGVNYNSPQTIWSVRFATEHPGVYTLGDDELGQLKIESQRVPMITGLTETVKFTEACIQTQGGYTNTSFIKNTL